MKYAAVAGNRPRLPHSALSFRPVPPAHRAGTQAAAAPIVLPPPHHVRRRPRKRGSLGTAQPARRSMKAIRGVLLTCDSAVKQILLTLNEKENFIIEDLDDYHVVIKADEEYRVRRELEAELEKNTYSLE
ncbi:transcription factor TFIIH complex subunit Tfb5-domain-containing protein [Trametes meyenii]|nr:transcription factor TFIIH complex subunit Tfb5-domain-containing protein [Trametes meyenii]